MVEGVYANFNWTNHLQHSCWLIGCCGPFGIIDSMVSGKITYPVLHLDGKIKHKQNESFNCGVIWCLFIFDVMQQALIPYDFEYDKKERFLLPVHIRIGQTWFHPTQWKNIFSNN